MQATPGDDYRLTATATILQTSESGDRLAVKSNVKFRRGEAAGCAVQVEPSHIRQTLRGIGAAFTESSAFVLAHLDIGRRRELMRKLYGAEGADFSMARTVIGATDFAVKGRYSYDDVDGDIYLKHFSVAPDTDGFSRKDYPGIKDESFDLLPMIQEALQIKRQQADPAFSIVASAWTAPSWMKDIEDWYIRGDAGNDYQGTGGRLKKGYEQTYAEYLLKYIEAYAGHGVDIWAITPVNEPLGNSGQWESMHFTAETQKLFVRNFLGPALRSSDHPDVKILMYDHNRPELEDWADLLYGDPDTARYLHGAAVHWYSSTVKVYGEIFDSVHAAHPRFEIIHTESCIDDLGKAAPGGVMDPAGYKEENWFDNDDFWWNRNATDWAYTATWQGVIAEDHPMYTPVHRYARDIIGCINHWVSGWVDWNIVLDRHGGPNHVGNYCGAPVMVDTATGTIHYTPVYHVLSQFSRTIRPGDVAVEVRIECPGMDADAVHACATLTPAGLLTLHMLNTTKAPVDYNLKIGAQYAGISIAANALQSVCVQLEPGD